MEKEEGRETRSGDISYGIVTCLSSEGTLVSCSLNITWEFC